MVAVVSDLTDRFDRPLRDLRISVIDRCNFRCPYCMPATIYHEAFPFVATRNRLSVDEIDRLARLFVSLGVSKLRVTGGEPLLRREIIDIVGCLAAIPEVDDLALTTNGALLERHAAGLKAAGLGRLTLSIDSLDAEVFSNLSGGLGSVDQTLAGMLAAEEAGFGAMKINTVVQRGVNEHTVLDLLERFRGTGHIVRFIEYMDVGTCNQWHPEQVVSSSELLEMIGPRWPVEALDEQYFGEVASRYRYQDGKGEIGFVSSISKPFCGSCTRARLSSEGVLYTCLFAHQGLDLRGPMREGASDDELQGLIQDRWRARADRYSEQRDAAANPHRLKVEMYRVGG